MPLKTISAASLRSRFPPMQSEKAPPDLKRPNRVEVAPQMRFSLPMPPSANRYWRLGADGHLHRSAEARAYKIAVAHALAEKNLVAVQGAVSISIDVFRAQKSGDLDNRLKVLIDALQGHCYENDSQIVAITARRFEDANNPRVEVEINEVKP